MSIDAKEIKKLISDLMAERSVVCNRAVQTIRALLAERESVVLAERKRCAKVAQVRARQLREHRANSPLVQSACVMAEEIAAEIRRLK